MATTEKYQNRMLNMTMKVIHFIVDDKFINGTIALLDEFDWLENQYYIFTNKHYFKYITLDRIQKINKHQILEIITDSNSCDVIVIHGLASLPSKYICSINRQIKVCWLAWGYDIYSNTYPQFPLIKLKDRIRPKTLDLVNTLIYYSKYGLREGLYRLLPNKRKEHKLFFKAINRFDFFSGVYPIEYKLVKNNPFFRAKPILYSYVSLSIKQLYRPNSISNDVLPKGNNIQVGHCSSILCNHIDTFNRIKKLNLGDRKIITPLSYGANNYYVSSVCRAGYKMFRNNFVPLKKFIPKEDYICYMSSVSMAIFNIDQQSAAGGIKISLWNGAMVFLPEKSIGYEYFRGMGYIVFCIEKDLTQENIEKGLSEEQIMWNRKLLSSTTTYEILKKQIMNSFKTIQDDILSENDVHN